MLELEGQAVGEGKEIKLSAVVPQAHSHTFMLKMNLLSRSWTTKQHHLVVEAVSFGDVDNPEEGMEPGALPGVVAGLLVVEVRISEVVCGEAGEIGKRHASRQKNSLTHLTIFSRLEQSHTRVVGRHFTAMVNA